MYFEFQSKGSHAPEWKLKHPDYSSLTPDVLKFDVKDCDHLHEINAELRKKPHTSNFPDYHPHATIAYLKPGTAKSYVEKHKDVSETVKPTEIVYSKADGTKRRKSLL